MTFGGNVSGPGGFIKTGGKTLTLTGTNSSTGANFVTPAHCPAPKSAALGTGALSISDGAIVNLNYSGTRTIAALTLGGTNQPPGIYGSTSSSAATKDPHFTGTGTVTVAASASLTNTPATGITTTTAALNATLACLGTNFTVYAHWNTVNGGTNAALWTNSVYVGSWTNVAADESQPPGFRPQPSNAILLHLPRHEPRGQCVGDQRPEFHDAHVRAADTGAARQRDHDGGRNAGLLLRHRGRLQVSPGLQEHTDGGGVAAGPRAAGIPAAGRLERHLDRRSHVAHRYQRGGPRTALLPARSGKPLNRGRSVASRWTNRRHHLGYAALLAR